MTPKGPVCNSCSYKRQFEEEPRFAKKWPDEFRFGTNVLPRRFGVDSSQD